MSSTSFPASGEMDAIDQQRRLLAIARGLDRFGRKAEQMLLLQFEQLELALEDFEREKAAWRRQQKRETAELKRLRDELLQHGSSINVPDLDEPSEEAASQVATIEQQPLWTETDAVEQAVRDSGGVPIRLLLQPGSANALQLGLLLFEISQLNRELGGDGVRFEMAESRELRRGLFGQVPAGLLLELEGFSAIPLTIGEAEPSDEFNQDLTVWMDFKTRLLLAECNHRELEGAFRRARVAPRPHALRSLIIEATRCADDAHGNHQSERRPSNSLSTNAHRIDPVRQQLERLESCVECLNKECNLQLYFSLR